LVHRHPSILDFRQRLAEIHEEQGVLQQQLGRLIEARASFLLALESRQFMGIESDDLVDRTARVHFELGEWHRLADRVEEASRSYQAAKELHANHHGKDDRTYAMGLSQSLLLIGVNLWDSNRPADALDACASAREITARLVREDPLNSAARRLLAAAYVGEALSFTMLERPDKAIQAVEAGIEQLLYLRDRESNEQITVGLNTSYFLLAGIFRQQSQVDAAEEAEACCQESLPGDPRKLVSLARLYATEGQRFGRGKTEFSPADRFHFERYRNQAIKCLAAAIDAGGNPGSLRDDPAFVTLYSDPGFRQLIAAP
jgi:tetratricopeptide (TPR) repeat protein